MHTQHYPHLKNVTSNFCTLLVIGAVSICTPRALAQTDSVKDTEIPSKQPEKSNPVLQGRAEEKTNQNTTSLEGRLERTEPLEGKTYAEQLQNQSAKKAMSSKAAAANVEIRVDEKSQPLQGRLEQIRVIDARLPLELTSIVNKQTALSDIKLVREIPKLDPALKSKLLRANLTQLTSMTSFPDFLVGIWGGHLNVLSRSVVIPDPADTHIVTGDIGTVVVRFYKYAQNVEVLPPVVFFKQRPTDRIHYLMGREPDPSVQMQPIPEILTERPFLDMGSGHAHNGLGEQWQDNVIHHSLQRLSTNVAEQDTVVERYKENAPYGYRETVARYTWTTKSAIYVQAAVVDYTMERKLRKRTIMAGYIVPQWHSYAQEIAVLFGNTWENVEKILDMHIDR